MKLCEECKKMGCLHTLCRSCFPKRVKAKEAFDVYKAQTTRDFTDTKASEWPVHNELFGGEQ